MRSFNFAVILSFVALMLSMPMTHALDIKALIGVDFSAKTHYNAPTPPWVKGAKPGWYFGAHPERHPKLLCLSGFICRILKLFPMLPQCPPRPTPQPTSSSTTPSSTASSAEPTPTPPADGYIPTFENLEGATQADGYLTFGLVDTVADCKAMCNSVAGCVFVNTYNDVNGKDGSTQLTCSLFRDCHDASTATNTGGQTQPDGSINYIRNSSGWCKA